VFNRGRHLTAIDGLSILDEHTNPWIAVERQHRVDIVAVESAQDHSLGREKWFHPARMTQASPARYARHDDRISGDCRSLEALSARRVHGKRRGWLVGAGRTVGA